MKTILIVVLMSLTNPNIPANVLHKAFNSPEACQTAYTTVTKNMPHSDTVKVSGFCISADDLLEPTI